MLAVVSTGLLFQLLRKEEWYVHRNMLGTSTDQAVVRVSVGAPARIFVR